MDPLVFNLTLASTIVQALLAIFALWYTIETRSLRKHASKQLAVLERQHVLAVAPYVVTGLVSRREMIKNIKEKPEEFLEIKEGENLEQRVAAAVSELEGEKKEIFYCTLYNPTSKLTLEIEVFIYESKNKHFLEGDTGQTAIAEKDSDGIWITGDPLNQDELIGKVRESYGKLKDVNGDLFPHTEESYVVVIFRDVEQATYMNRRRFVTLDDGEIVMRRPEFKVLK